METSSWLTHALIMLASAQAFAAPPRAITLESGTSTGWYTSLRFDGDRAFVSFYDQAQGDLRMASCAASCTSADASWQLVTVDSIGDVGRYSSLQLGGGNPIIAYNDVTAGSLKLATCIARCTAADPEWVITTVDESAADTGRFPSLQLSGGKPVIGYRDRSNGLLKLATCVADCASRAATWIITTVDRDGDTGRFAQMQLADDGRPVIAYYDATHGTVKFASCTGACQSSSPTWAIDAFDTVPNEDEMQLGLALIGGNPVVSYYDAPNMSLKLATCTAGCATASRAWIVTTVESAAGTTRTSNASVHDAGSYSSLSARNGRPVVAYLGTFFNCTWNGAHGHCHTATDLRLAVCAADCTSASPTWDITTVDNSGLAGYDASLQVVGDSALVSYQDLLHPSAKVATVDMVEASRPVNYTALWWQSDESGWGVNFSHQGDTVFATLFTYDADGSPMWLVMSNGEQQSPRVFSGPLYRTTGPAFNANPFVPIAAANVTRVGTMTATFAGDSASLAYDVNGTGINKTVRRQVFGEHAASCHPTSEGRAPLANHEDLWWNPAESGWGINLAQQGDVIFATLFTYDATGRGVWFVMSAGTRNADGSYSGALYRTTGPAFDAVPFTPIGAANVAQVGTMQLRFSDGVHGTLAYTVDGISVTKAIERQVFSAPLPACDG